MSNEKNTMATAGAPSAPAASGYNHRPPPPSYEESQRMYGSAANRVAPNSLPNSYMQPYNYNASPQQAQTSMYVQNYAPPPPQYYQHHYVTATAPITFNNVQTRNESHILSLAPGAKVRTTPAGAVSIPPPPPGCAPTAAQYAAIQGQPVVLKKTKRSFF